MFDSWVISWFILYMQLSFCVPFIHILVSPTTGGGAQRCQVVGGSFVVWFNKWSNLKFYYNLLFYEWSQFKILMDTCHAFRHWHFSWPLNRPNKSNTLTLHNIVEIVCLVVEGEKETHTRHTQMGTAVCDMLLNSLFIFNGILILECVNHPCE